MDEEITCAICQTVACYTADPLASDSDYEKKIRKAIKESKQLREERK